MSFIVVLNFELKLIIFTISELFTYYLINSLKLQHIQYFRLI